MIVKEGPFELREYPPLVVAETVVAGARAESERAAFRRLFDYIGGENAVGEEIAMTAPVIEEPASEKIAMTAPVLQEATPQGWKMAFVLPAEYTIGNAPRPSNPEVELSRIEGGKVATVRFSGSRSDERLEEETRRLNEWMAARGLRPISEPRSAGYDPPFTLPFLRRNEVWVRVE